jgi:hypothetical protein
MAKSTLFVKMASWARLTAMSTSASLKIIRGDLPPNSRETDFKLLFAAASMTSRPTSVDPVKLTYHHKWHVFHFIYTIKDDFLHFHDSQYQYNINHSKQIENN